MSVFLETDIEVRHRFTKVLPCHTYFTYWCSVATGSPTATGVYACRESVSSQPGRYVTAPAARYPMQETTRISNCAVTAETNRHGLTLPTPIPGAHRDLLSSDPHHPPTHTLQETFQQPSPLSIDAADGPHTWRDLLSPDPHHPPTRALHLSRRTSSLRRSCRHRPSRLFQPVTYPSRDQVGRVRWQFVLEPPEDTTGSESSQSPPSPGNVLAGLSTPVATSAMPVSLRFMSEMRNTIPRLRFAAVIMHIRDPKTTALIFASDSRLASRKYAHIVQKLDFDAKFSEFKIQNIVGSCDVNYKSKLFPGLIYRMIKPKVVLLIFVSGKVVLTGAKVREEICTAFALRVPEALIGISTPHYAADVDCSFPVAAVTSKCVCCAPELCNPADVPEPSSQSSMSSQSPPSQPAPIAVDWRADLEPTSRNGDWLNCESDRTNSAFDSRSTLILRLSALTIMGIPGLYDRIKQIARVVSLHEVSALEGFIAQRREKGYIIVGIDACLWIQGILHGQNMHHVHKGSNAEVKELLRHLVKLLNFAIVPLFVFDGPERPKLKRGKRVVHSPGWLIGIFKELIDAFGFYHLDARGEAEAELAALNYLGFEVSQIRHFGLTADRDRLSCLTGQVKPGHPVLTGYNHDQVKTGHSRSRLGRKANKMTLEGIELRTLP
ncbi:hypothetical protein BDZ89DRAFT_1035729 [Hymenopellis radicata]|nr:hypothetical protein BDZ89DRAFT_1035729 [Hymenopellis radicata]